MYTQNLGHLISRFFSSSLSNKCNCLEIFFFFKPERLAYQSFSHIRGTKTSFPKSKFRGKKQNKKHLVFPVFPSYKFQFTSRICLVLFILQSLKVFIFDFFFRVNSCYLWYCQSVKNLLSYIKSLWERESCEWPQFGVWIWFFVFLEHELFQEFCWYLTPNEPCYKLQQAAKINIWVVKHVHNCIQSLWIWQVL